MAVAAQGRSGVAALRPVPRRTIVITSGGLGSTVLAYWMAARGSEVTLVSFDHGQRHHAELQQAARIADLLRRPHEIVDLSGLRRLLTGSPSTGGAVPMPDGRRAEEPVPATVLANRNAIMLDVAVGMAVTSGADAVAFGAHTGDHASYPDCRPEFVECLARAARIANEGRVADGFDVLAPFLTYDKTDIVRIGEALAVPFEQTWSCFRAEATHCGTCGPCTRRRRAFERAGVADPTCYRTT